MEESLLKVLAAWGYHVQLGAAIWVTVLLRVLKTQCGKSVFHGHSPTSFRGGRLSYWRMNTSFGWQKGIPFEHLQSLPLGKARHSFVSPWFLPKPVLQMRKPKSGSWRKVQETKFQMQPCPNCMLVSFFPCLPQERFPPRQSLRAPQKSCSGKSLASVQRTDDKARTYWARSMARLSSKYPTPLPHPLITPCGHH